ncbi:MAG: DEAD/DEAH box helicase family protein, partial [Candidatus Micrarchaeota archaeon]|nr:DEAD/DEAH box helicase family protein [Candidatus Micrarchaeota archaeon]
MVTNTGHKLDTSLAKPFEYYRETAINNLESYRAAHYGANAVLRGRQVTVFDDLISFVKNGGQEGYVALPTSAGKTPLYIKFMESIMGNTDMKCIIAVPTNVMVDQTQRMLHKFLDKDEIEALRSKIGILNYLHKDYGAPILITTYKSLQMRTDSGV